MAALLGAQTSTRAVGPASSVVVLFFWPGMIATTGRGRLAIKREIRPHIVDVFPVPGGLEQI